MLFFFLGRKYKIFKYLSLILLMVFALHIIFILILSKKMNLGISNIKLNKFKNRNYIKIYFHFQNNSFFNFNLKDFNIKSKNAEFLDSLLDFQTDKKFKGKELPSGSKESIILYKQMKIYKKPIGECDAFIILSKYFYNFKIPTKFNI